MRELSSRTYLLTTREASLFILAGTAENPFYPETKTKPQSGGEKAHKADLGDFNVVLRGRLAQSRQIWVLRPAVGK